MKQRLQKLISMAGVASRRASEKLILDGRVAINGVPAALGESADPETDIVTLDGKPLRFDGERVYIMLNKPRGYVSTLSDERGRKTVAELISGAGVRLYPVGRLDMWSEGLLLMTDDGELAKTLTHPSHEIPKTYEALVEGDVPAAVKAFESGMELEGERLRPAKCAVLRQSGETTLLQIIITEGKNRQIRRMCAAAELRLFSLRRVAEGGLALGELASGRWRHLSPDEVQLLKGEA